METATPALATLPPLDIAVVLSMDIVDRPLTTAVLAVRRTTELASKPFLGVTELRWRNYFMKYRDGFVHRLEKDRLLCYS